MFSIIKTPRNYFTRELLHDRNVAFHCKKSLAAILGGKLSEEVFCRPSTAPVGWSDSWQLLGAVLCSSDEPGELSQSLCYDNRTVNIVVNICVISMNVRGYYWYAMWFTLYTASVVLMYSVCFYFIICEVTCIYCESVLFLCIVRMYNC